MAIDSAASPIQAGHIRGRLARTPHNHNARNAIYAWYPVETVLTQHAACSDPPGCGSLLPMEYSLPHLYILYVYTKIYTKPDDKC